jgi:hypothetical protein
VAMGLLYTKRCYNPSYDDTANIVLKVKVGLLVFNWYI